MNAGQILVGLAVAGAIALGVKTFLAPKFEPAPSNSSAANTEVHQSLNSATTEARSARLSARLYQKDDGHYWAKALVNKKTTVQFLVDTGASVVALTYKDAQKIGLNPNKLDYNARISTAGGVTFGAYVTIDSIRINQVQVKNIEAVVIKEGLDKSLLGMSFLRQLYSYEFRGERMIIKQ